MIGKLYYPKKHFEYPRLIIFENSFTATLKNIQLTFKDYFTNRIQRTRIGPDTSNSSPLNIGVPQCLVLVSLLFDLYY